MDRCGAITKAGGPCRWPRGECQWHIPVGGEPFPTGSVAPLLGAAQADAPVAPEREEFPWLDGRDLRGLGWWLVEGTLRQRVGAREASVVASLLRTLAALGPDEGDTEDALREVELRGVLMHGMPPRTPEEWARAARIFDDDALAEFRRWERLLLEADHGDRPEPLDPGEVRAGDVDVSRGIDDEDRG